MIGLLSVLLSTVLWHPAQESLTELQFNEQTQRVEIALRLSIADEQQLLRGVTRASLDTLVESPEELKAAAVEVLCQRLRWGTEVELESTSKQRADRSLYLWAGRKSEGGHVWWFFEYSGTPDQLTHVRCTLFAAPEQASDVTPRPTAHNHPHAESICTFVVLPQGGREESESTQPNSFTTTNKQPVARIRW